MPNSFTPLLPTLISEYSIAYLRKRSGFLGRTYVETTQESILRGGNSVTIPKPASIFTPTNVSYTSAATAQDITIPSVALTFGNHKEIKVQANMLESRISQGNFERIMELTINGMLDGLVSQVDGSIASLYSSATHTVGTPGVALTDANLRKAAGILASNNVNLQSDSDRVNFVTTPSDYYNGLLSNANYVLALNIGGTEAIRGGKIPSLYNINVDYSQNVVTNLVSPVTNHNLMFEKFAFVIGFVEFEPASTYSANAPVDEQIVTDPDTGISVRTQKYYDASLRTWYYQMDCKWGVNVLDADRFVDVQS